MVNGIGLTAGNYQVQMASKKDLSVQKTPIISLQAIISSSKRIPQAVWINAIFPHLKGADRQALIQINRELYAGFKTAAIQDALVLKKHMAIFTQVLYEAAQSTSHVELYQEAIASLQQMPAAKEFNTPLLDLTRKQRGLDAKIYTIIKPLISGNQHLLKSQDVLLLMGTQELTEFFKYKNGVRQDRQFFATLVQKNGLALQHVPPELQDDKEVVLAAVAQEGLALLYASDRLKQDEDVVMTAVKQNGYAIKYVDDTLANLANAILAALKTTSSAFQKASLELRNSRKFVLAAVAQNGWILEYLSKDLRNNHQVVLTAVKNVGDALQFASKKLRRSKKIVLAAMQNSHLAKKYAAGSLKKSKKMREEG
jgi:hypothetical protein